MAKKRFLKWHTSSILKFKNFHIWSPGYHRVPNLLLCTKFHQNWMIFTVRCICTVQTMPWQDVCLYVRHTQILSLNGYTYPGSFLTIK